MERRHSPRTRAIAGAALAAGLALGLGAPTAHAGGWAVTTVDELPPVVVGEPVEIGFTIRQHGVTPVALDEGVALEVTAPDGAVEVFPASPEGPVGHYVATIVVTTAAEHTWSVHQGWFAEQDLGPLVVAAAPPLPAAVTTPPAPAPAPATATAEYRFPAALRWGLPVLGAALLVGSVVSRPGDRARRRRPVPSAAAR